MYRDSGREFHLFLCQSMMRSIHLALGDLEEARNSMEEAMRLSHKNGEKALEGSSLVGLGRVFGKSHRESEKVEKCFDEGLSILKSIKLKSWYSQGLMFLGEFYRDGGQKEKALEHLKGAEALFQEMGMNYWLDRTREMLGKL